MLYQMIFSMSPALRRAIDRQPLPRLTALDFSELDRQIEKLRALRDDYRAANVAHYGEFLAGLLND